MLANFHICGIMLLLRAIYTYKSKRVYVFRCLMFNLSGPYELLCLLYFITCVVVSVMLWSCIFCIDLSMVLFVLCVACLKVCLYIVWGNNCTLGVFLL